MEFFFFWKHYLYLYLHHKTQAVTNVREEHYILVKGSIQNDIPIINTYAANIDLLKCINQILRDIQGKIGSNIVIVGDFNSPLTSVDRSSGQKINRKTMVWNDTLDQVELVDNTYTTQFMKGSRIHIFSSINGTCSRIDHILGHKTASVDLRKFITSMFFSHSTMKLENNYKKRRKKKKNCNKTQTSGGQTIWD